MNCHPLPSASKRPEAIDALRSKIRLRPRRRDINFAPEPRSAQWGDRRRPVRERGWRPQEPDSSGMPNPRRAPVGSAVAMSDGAQIASPKASKRCAAYCRAS